MTATLTVSTLPLIAALDELHRARRLMGGLRLAILGIEQEIDRDDLNEIGIVLADSVHSACAQLEAVIEKARDA